MNLHFCQRKNHDESENLSRQARANFLLYRVSFRFYFCSQYVLELRVHSLVIKSQYKSSYVDTIIAYIMQ